MGKYKQTRKPNYIPLNRFKYISSPKELPMDLRLQVERRDTKFKGLTQCGVCEQESLLVFEVDAGDESGEIYICGNPECPIYLDPEYYPAKGGR